MNYDLKTPFTEDQKAWLEDSITSMMMRCQLAEREIKKTKIHLNSLLDLIRVKNDKGGILNE
jgi:hypothetical protein